MDPKMDSGYLRPGETMEDNYDYGQALLPEEIIGIIDQLLCHEVCALLQPYNIQKFILTGIDGLAYGTSPWPDSLHKSIY